MELQVNFTVKKMYIYVEKNELNSSPVENKIY